MLGMNRFLGPSLLLGMGAPLAFASGSEQYPGPSTWSPGGRKSVPSQMWQGLGISEAGALGLQRQAHKGKG